MSNKILAAIALFGLAAFLSVVPIFVPRIDLIILTVGCLLMAFYDFWQDVFRRR